MYASLGKKVRAVICAATVGVALSAVPGSDEVAYADDFIPICILHGNPNWDADDPETWISFNDWAFGGYVDPKVESTDGTNVNLGLSTFNVVFSTEPFGDADGGAVTADNVSVEETGGEVPPDIISVIKDGRRLTVELDRIITLQEWTTLVFDVWDGSGVRIVDDDSCARLVVGFLPGAVLSGCVQPVSINRWIQAWLTRPDLPSGIRAGHPSDYLDVSRNGFTDPLDLSRLIAAMKGQPPFTRNWRQECMNTLQP